METRKHLTVEQGLAFTREYFESANLALAMQAAGVEKDMSHREARLVIGRPECQELLKVLRRDAVKVNSVNRGLIVQELYQKFVRLAESDGNTSEMVRIAEYLDRALDDGGYPEDFDIHFDYDA